MDIADDALTAALGEFLALTEVNLRGRPPIEAGMRARALQEISALDTDALAALAARVTAGAWREI